MRGLTILVATADPARFRAALTLAAAHAALGGRTRLFLHEEAVTLLRPAGAELAHLIATATESGATLIACQTGLARAGLAETDLPAGAETGGLIGLLATLDEDRLDTI
jgi:predicted peroxiredoxin